MININTNVPTPSTQVSVSQFGVPVVTDLTNLAKLPNAASLNAAAGSGSTTSASFVNLPATSSITFTKKFDSSQTKLLVWMTHGGRVSAVPTTVEGGVNINSIDYQVTRYAISTNTSQNEQWSGHREITGVGAGTYTIQMRHRIFFGSGTVTIDNNTWISLTVMEVPS